MKIGEFNELRINRMVDFGAYLIDDDTHEVLLPKRYLTPEMKVTARTALWPPPRSPRP